jgi:hypothetical protein
LTKYGLLAARADAGTVKIPVKTMRRKEIKCIALTRDYTNKNVETVVTKGKENSRTRNREGLTLRDTVHIWWKEVRRVLNSVRRSK